MNPQRKSQPRLLPVIFAVLSVALAAAPAAAAAQSGGWAMDNHFDLTYRIDFVGAACGVFSGRSGSKTGTVRIQLGGTAVYDHLECFKFRDSVKLSGVVNLPTLAGTPSDAAGCKVESARKFSRRR